MTARVHAARHGDRLLGRTLCGLAAALLADEAAKVTCKKCRRILDRSPDRRAPVTIEEAAREILHVIGGPPVQPYPSLTPEIWRAMRCRLYVARREAGESRGERGAMCFCDFCLIDASNARAKANWETEQQLRPHRQHAHPFGSVNQALEAWARWTLNGASVRSSQGSLQARCLEIARLGTHVQTTRRHDREDLSIRRVTYATDVDRAIARAYAQPADRRGLTLAQCRALLLASVASDAPSLEEQAEALGVSERIVRAVVRHGRRQVTIELVVSGYIPEPRARSGLLAAIERRRREIGEVAS